MKIAQIAPIIERVPPKKYGGIERVVSALTEELAGRGHEVTLFASGDSITAGKLASVYPKSLREVRLKDIYGLNVWSMLHLGNAYEHQDEFDIIHDHTGYFGLPLGNIAKTPSLFTLHGPFTAENRHIFRKLKKPFLVTISNAQATVLDLHHAGTVHNGLKMQDYPFSEEHDNYLLFVGRISMEKGTHVAVEAALNLNLPLIIAAKLEMVDMPYFREYIEPFLSDQIQWIGEVDEKKRNELYSRALCFLHPVTWREPFGLTMIEAMACGCPVVGFNKGSVSEIVKNGETGFVVEDIEGMLDAIEKIGIIDRNKCRLHSLANFGADKMADGYETIYQKILGRDII